MKESIIQFGSGNFLRGFFDCFIHILIEQGLFDGKIVVVQPTKNGKTKIINEQNGKYNLYLRGIKNGKETCERVNVNSISRGVDPYTDYSEYIRLAEDPNMRFIVSNTTEAGIVFDGTCRFCDEPALSFPGKLTQLLFHRFEKQLSGFVILPCELIDNNGDELKKCVVRYAEYWKLGDAFLEWIEKENRFCNTLVDRIVPGFPSNEVENFYNEIGYEDRLLVTAENFHLWVIEGNFEEELPFKRAGLNVIWTKDVSPYKKMKVRILNGAHTSLVFPSLLSGVELVRESLNDELLRTFLDKCLFSYILLSLDETEESKIFASEVIERFNNPYIDHKWLSIALNSVSKFTVRVLPTVNDITEKCNIFPEPLFFSLACLIEYYKKYDVQDDEKAVKFIKEHNVEDILKNTALWGRDISYACCFIERALGIIQNKGVREAIKWSLDE